MPGNRVPKVNDPTCRKENTSISNDGESSNTDPTNNNAAALKVIFNCETEGAVIFYTPDGTDPTRYM